MSEFRAPHTVARLIGSPPGYVGYGDGGQLTEPVRRRPYSVILLDEIEKAHPEVWNVLLQLMDDGRLTDGEGRTVDFTNTVVVMTSNLGAGEARRGLGFTADAARTGGEDRMRAAAKEAFLPEFLNRIDEIVTFSALTPEQVEEIAGIVVGRTAARLREERGITLEVDAELVAQLARDGFDEQFGARPLERRRRTLEKALTRRSSTAASPTAPPSAPASAPTARSVRPRRPCSGPGSRLGRRHPEPHAARLRCDHDPGP